MRLAAILLLSLGTAAGAAEPTKGFTATPLGGSVTLLQGWECNNPVSAGEDGIVLVDTCGAKVADRLLAAAQRLSAKPLRFVIDSHAHGDHTSGNAVFQKLAPVIAHHNVRTRMAAGNEKTRDKPAAPDALPI